MSAKKELVCWKCGTSLHAITLPFRRMEVCPQCDAELHVCKMCTYYDPRVAEACLEEQAEEVRDKERANFCDYFKPSPGAFATPDKAAARASRTELDALFGGGGVDTEDAAGTRRSLEDLFRGKADDD